MKISRLLVLTALWLGMTGVAKAEVPDNVWTVPAPTGLEFTDVTLDGQHYYLFNPASNLFFASGNEWNTRASLASFGYEVWFTPAEEEGAPEGSYVFNDNCQHPDRQLGEKTLFTDDGGSTWCDRGSQANWSWTVTKAGDFYRIQNVALIAKVSSYEGKFFGWNGTADNRLYMLDPATEGVSVDWKFVTVDSYEEFIYTAEYADYKAAAEVYFSGMALGASLKAAEELGINIATWLAVYTNTSSTKEELDAAKTAVDEVITAKKNLQKLVDAGDLVNAPTDDAKALLANADATAAELKAAADALTPIVEARQALKKLLDEAKEAGFTATADYDAVYNDKASTVAQLKAAYEALSAAFTEWSKNNATWDKPGDMSNKIVNPNFDNASPAGWSGSTPNMTGSGAHGPANVPEFWNATFDTYQDIKELPVGVYALTAQTMWRGSWNDMQNGIVPASKLYVKAGDMESVVPFNYAYGPKNTTSMAGDTPWGVGAGEQSYTDEETGTTYYIPNDPSCFRLYAEAGLYDTKVLFGVFDGNIRIGVKNPAKAGDADNWSCFDTFKLIFYGNGADACQNYITEAMKNFSEYVIEEGTLYTEAYLTAYQQAYEGEKTASSMDDVEAILGGINTAKANLDKNIQLWKDYQALLKKAAGMLVDSKYQRVELLGELGDYVEIYSEDYIKDHKLTNEELEAEIAGLQALMDQIDDISKTLLQEGDNVTYLIKNPGFDDDADINYGGAEGWTVDRVDGGNVVRGPLGQGNKDLMESALGYMNYCFESWHCHKWDIWQEITNLPQGIYELSVQGYVRCEVGGYTRGDDIEPNFPSPVYLYMNNSLSSFPSVYSECPADEGYEFTTVESWTVENVNGNDYPNSMGGAAQCFAWGMYKTKAYGLVAENGGNFRIGVKMDKNQDWWCIFDNFQLIYHEPTNAALIKPILQEALAGINLEQPMGKDIYEKAAAVKAAAEAAIAANDGAKMFEALNQVYDLSAAIIESVSLFEDLVAANESLIEAINNGVNTKAIAEATALSATIEAGVQDHSITDAEAKAYIERIDILYTKLALPDNIDSASDENPIDVTAAIKSPSFVNEYEESSSTGWTNAGNLGNDDEQKAAGAIEFWQIKFDMFQTIKGLPEGTYELTADAWCRIGGNDENYAEWTADNNATMALIYGVDGDSTVYSSYVANMMKAGEALTEATGYQGETEFTTGDVTYYLPGSLVSGKGIIELNPGVYTNSVIVKVKADEVLTIGIKKGEERTNSWVVCDDFHLYYLGKNSSKQPGKDLTGIEDVNAQKRISVEYFTLDGRKATGAQKGIVIQKVTFANGATLVQKIRK